MSGQLARANPRRIKAAHRRRGKVASGQSVQRYYDPGIGRFLSVDPVTADGNTGANFNRYKYAENNPYRFTDPDGRRSCPTPRDCPGAGEAHIEEGVSGVDVKRRDALMTMPSFRAEMQRQRTPSATVRQPEPLPAKEAKDGRLTPLEARKHFKKGNGQPIIVDQGKLTVIYRRNPDGSSRAIVYGIEDYAVHGQVSINPENMRIYDAPYEFEWHPNNSVGNMLRNYGNIFGRALNGDGTPFMIQYRGGDPKIINISAPED